MSHKTLTKPFEAWQDEDIDGKESLRLLRERDEYEKNNAARLREHRRYEIARDCLAAYCGNTDQSVWREPSQKLASWSVECADALLAELEKKP